MYFSTEPPVTTGLPFYKTVVCLTCVLILIINGVSLFHNLGSLKGANEIQGQTAKVIDKVQYVNVLIMDAESSLRGYFLSGSEVYLGPLRTASSEIDAQFAELERLLADSPSQRRNLAQLHTLVYRRLDTMNQVLDVYRQGGLDDILKIAGSSDSKAEMDEIRLQVVILVQEQNELLSARSATFYREYRHAVFLGITINAMAILVLALFYRLIRRSYFARDMTQRALENANDNLESMVALRTEQLSVLSRHLISVSEEEKARLARELHDELGANLTSINIGMNAVADALRAERPELAMMLDRARATLVDTVELKRRIVEDLRPSLLDHLGLSAAVQSYCEEFGRVAGLDCEALIDGDVDVAGPMHAIAVFRIVQESLNNIAKYARARHVIVHLGREAGGLSLEVSDDGVGIDSDAVAKPKSHGLLGMRERALLLGGSLRVKRGVNEVGTCVEAFIPLSRAADSGDSGDAAPEQPAPLPFSGLHPSEGDRIPSSRPYSIRRRTPPGPGGRSP
ncbi:CHASE3 domain-containing protein [Massilia sp. CCM 9210]|uniref:CHASE3 domain-containing protein n=1 Tax=Massilia scottii TaxID=3057166 RepID=UPI0027969CE0|nr:CHASE3 domain-containing protein [Massilia sp. CCM 9210]MDQ1812245.1 CHASE3 domain-containing protein [Massilia sp. CCM 9210]